MITPKTFQNSVVVITGASSGIGMESAMAFARAKAKVALLARRTDKLEEIKKSILDIGGFAETYATNVADEKSVKETFETIEKDLGSVDILINNAGVGFATDLATCSLEDYQRIIDTNVTGLFLCCRAVLPGMKNRRSGHIINISSVAGKSSNPIAPVYCSSKHALRGYTSGLQQQVAPDNIRVSMISPGAVDTAYWDGRQADRSKFLKAEEVSAAIFFIASQPDGVLIKDLDIAPLR